MNGLIIRSRYEERKNFVQFGKRDYLVARISTNMLLSTHINKLKMKGKE